MPDGSRPTPWSRRHFIKTATATGAAVALPVRHARAADTRELRVGLVGCGGRGTRDTISCLTADPGVVLTALGDVYPAPIEKCRRSLEAKFGDRVRVPESSRFSGFDAYQKVIDSDIDLVLLITPPFFRPQHLAAAVKAGRHAFVEKPVATDPAGIRRFITAAREAETKGLSIVAGTQARRMPARIEMVQRIRDGAIGDITGGQVYRLGGGMRGWGPSLDPAKANTMDWQLRRWLFVNWLSGDFITEMHVHELDVMNWAMGGVPDQVIAQGGRSARVAPKFGNVFDHFSAEFTYPGDIKVNYMGSQIDGISGRTFERVVGTKGSAYTSWSRSFIEGENAWEYEGPTPNPEVQEFKDLIASVRREQPINEGVRIAESSLTSILTRMSAYTGRAASWKWGLNASKLDLAPPALEMGPLPLRPVAIPGKTKLI